MQKDWLKVGVLVLLLPVLTGCLSHTRKVRQLKLAGPVLDASALQLVDGINRRYDHVNSLVATVEFAASVGGAHKGKRTDYISTRGFILFRKPQMLRVLGQVPVLHTLLFDLASDGNTFTLMIPPKDRAIQGSNSVTERAKNPMENLRPAIFLDSILIHSISPDSIVSLIHESTTAPGLKPKEIVELPEYDLTVMSGATAAAAGQPPVAQVAKPLRVIRFSRVTLLPTELDIYNANGDLETQVLYGPYQDFNGVQFPTTIDIRRPLDEFGVTLTIEKLTVNQPLTDDQFQMKIPAGVQVQHIK